jgi:hypothetical protein
MFSSPLATALPSSTVARPNVRDQIERSREVRRRRARWLTGHAHDRRASE